MIVRGLFLTSALAAVLAAQEKIPADVQASVAQLFKMHEAWGPGLNSPNAAMTLKEISRSGQTIRYRIFASGLPREAVYTLVNWPVTFRSPVQALSGVTLDKTGLAICAGKPGTCGDPKTPNDPIDLPINPAKGEPVRLGLISGETLKAFYKIVPVPIAGTDKTCRAEIVLLTPKAEAVLLEASGFRAQSPLKMLTESEGERHELSVMADATGNYKSMVLPFVQGKQHGTMHVTVSSDACSPALNFPWGAE